MEEDAKGTGNVYYFLFFSCWFEFLVESWGLESV